MHRLLVVAVALASCSSPAAPGQPDTTPDGGRPDTLPSPDVRPADRGGDLVPPCGSAGQTLPPGLVELRWDNGKADGQLRAQPLVITVDSLKYDLSTAPLHEAVRFHLEHPARVHAFAIQWQNLAATTDPRAELSAGLYRDFGHNGFDFWDKEPLWTGTRCAKDAAAGSWLYYVLDKPVTVEHPGLVYVAHRSETSKDPVFAYESPAPAPDCATFDACQSSVNLPTAAVAPAGAYYRGISLPLPKRFLVRLFVEYTTQLSPSQRRFQKQTAVAPSSASVAWGDFNNDGWDDLLVGDKLYRNDQGTFTDVSQSSGIAALKTGARGGVWGDYDNDGCLDLFLFTEALGRADTLLRGDCKGGFQDVTAAAKLTDFQTYNGCGDPQKNTTSPTAAAAWLDLDADGFLDLYVANFICWASGATYVDNVFHNKGDGTFEDWTGTHGFLTAPSASRGAAPADFDGDGDVDLFVNAYRLEPNRLFVNDGKLGFAESASAVGAAGNKTGSYHGHSIGAAWGDLDSDGDLDLVVANLAHPRFWHFSDRTQILLNDGKGKLQDTAPLHPKPYGNPSGLRYQETHSVPLLGDFDRDGNLDLVITCVYDGRPTDSYRGKGDGTFVLDAYASGIETRNGWGVAASDYDNDGSLDLFATDLYRNAGGAGAHFLEVRVIGSVTSNRAAIGARVKVTAGGKSWLRQVQGGSGQGCQDSMYLHFGLGAESSVSEIRVELPGGKSVIYPGPIAADQRVWLYEDGATHLGWAPK
jgi:hypothetical protein